jgi:hypothetical protein
MSKATEEIGEIVVGVGLAIVGGVTGQPELIALGVMLTASGIAGLLAPQAPIGIGNTGLLPVQQPNALWRIQYGVFQAAAAIESFIDGPNLLWTGSGDNANCARQFLNIVHTLTCHQIAGYLSVTIDGETFNFGSDLIMQTPTNDTFPAGDSNPLPWMPGFWGFRNYNNPYYGYVFFHFDPGDPGYTAQPFPQLLAGATVEDPVLNIAYPVGSPKWTASCLQQGRAKVHILLCYQPKKNSATTFNGSGYPLANGRIPKFEFKIAGRIISDPRVQTAWQPSTAYVKHQYVLVTTGGVTNIWVQQNASGESGSTIPAFASYVFTGPGTTGIVLADNTCSWLNCGPPLVAAGSGITFLNNQGSIKLGGPNNSALIADAWQGSWSYEQGAVIEAPIGYLQQASSLGTTGINRPNFGTTLGGTLVDGGITWTCLGRSPYATMLPDNDGTQNTGGISNPALCLFDYLTTPRSQFGLGVTADAALIDSTIAAANVCDEPVPIMVVA